MKQQEFLALPAGTVVLLHPKGDGSRDHDSRFQLMLATLRDTRTYRRDHDFQSHKNQVPGFIESPNGAARSVGDVRLLEHYSADHTDASLWRRPSNPRAISGRDVRGVWDQVSADLLHERAAHFAALAEAATAERAEEARHVAALRVAMADVTGVFARLGLDLPATNAHPNARAFSVEQVSALLAALRETPTALDSSGIARARPEKGPSQ